MTSRERLSIAIELSLWLVIAGVAFALSFEFVDEQGTYAWRPASWPRAVIVLIVVGALVQAGSRYRAARARVPGAVPAAGATGWRFDPLAALRVAGMFALPLIYVFMLPRTGFYVTTPLFLAAYLFYLGERRPAALIGVPLVIFALIVFVFARLFYVALPLGNWELFYEISNWFLEIVR